MRNLILSMMMSVDGYMEAPHHDISWFVNNESRDLEDFMTKFLHRVDLYLYGRRSYELMIDYWPTAAGEQAEILNATPKLVFSRTLKNATWNAQIVPEYRKEDILQLKEQPGKDIVLFAGADLATSFIKDDLFDEYQLIVSAVVLGTGTPLFKELAERKQLQLLEAKAFANGDVVLRYQPKR